MFAPREREERTPSRSATGWDFRNHLFNVRVSYLMPKNHHHYTSYKPRNPRGAFGADFTAFGVI
ncbi:hypothetical protein Hanom_Chr01g00043921 [Helianthus anomalus]